VDAAVGSLGIRICDIGYATGGTEILRGVNADIPGGNITAVVGPSGAGKSTLLRAINRLIEPTAGEVYLDVEPTSRMNPLELRRRVGMVFQLPALFGATVEEATLYGARLAGRSADAGRLLEMVGLGASFKDKAPQSLSVGEQQRVSIARALALEPEALLVDEPTSALDEAARRRIEDLIRELNASLGLTIVLVSHALDQVERVADRVVFLVAGRSEGEWSKEEFFSGPGEQARRYIAGRT
jgi:ABC-type methionine transport system ATPase subunit